VKLAALALAGAALTAITASPASAATRPARALARSAASAGGAPAASARTSAAHSGSRHRHKAPPPPLVKVAPGIGLGGVTTTMQPVGLSIEYPVMAADLGGGECPPPALASTLEQLGSPPLALAGDSQDATAPAGALSAPASSWEAATAYQLPASFWSQLHCLLNATKDPLSVGLNARTGQASWAAQTVAAAEAAATNGVEFSLGNEPDLYQLPNWAELDKPLPNEETADVSAYLQVAEQLLPALAGAAAIGPELARPAHWQRELPRVIAQLHLSTVGVHMYPLTSCVTPKAVTIGGLLSGEAANLPHSIAWVAADASAAGVPAIISEANSASCGGVTGVSDSPAAAVWAVRFVLSALDSGFREVRFHSSGGPYDPFLVSGEQMLTRPLYTALVALNQWLPVGSSLRELAGVHGLAVSAVSQPGGATVLILDNQHRRPAPVRLAGVSGASEQVLSESGAGAAGVPLGTHGGLAKLVIAPNSVVAVTVPS